MRSCVLGRRLLDAVGGHEDRAVEAGELPPLLEPGATVVAHQVVVLLEEGIGVGRQHLAVGVDVDAGAAGLLEQVLEVAQVVTADEDGRVVPHLEGDRRGLLLAEAAGVGAVEAGHHLDRDLTGLEGQGRQSAGIGLGGQRGEGLDEEGVGGGVGAVEGGGVVIVGSHALEAEEDELAQALHVLLVTGRQAVAAALQGRRAEPVGGRVHAGLPATDVVGIEVDVGDRDEEPVGDQPGRGGVDGARCGRATGQAHQARDESVEFGGRLRRLAANTDLGAGHALARFLALVAEHREVGHHGPPGTGDWPGWPQVSRTAVRSKVGRRISLTRVKIGQDSARDLRIDFEGSLT